MQSSDRTGQRIGTYRYLRLLGRGVFSDTYLGEHIFINRQAAVKVLPIRLGEEDIRHFSQEMLTIAGLHHPHIVPILDFYLTDDHMPYIIMPYIAGGSLRHRYPKGTQLPLSVIVSYVKQVASALQYAHDHHIIHRNVKPENMLLESGDEILLSDFGISIAVPTSLSINTREREAGTAVYAAPEQLLGHSLAASDQYSLAVTVYEWLCGEPPFHEGPLFEVMSHHISTPPTPLRTKNPRIPREIEQVVLKALAKDPSDRFQSVQEFALVLEQATLELSVPHLRGVLELPLESKDIQTTTTALGDPPLLRRVHSSFYHTIGKALSILGFNKEALKTCEQAILLEAHHPPFYVGKGEILFNLKRYEEALAAFDEAIRLAPESSKAYRRRGKTYEQLARQSYEEFKRRAQQSYEKARELGVE